jgi:hypothetical protein
MSQATDQATSQAANHATSPGTSRSAWAATLVAMIVMLGAAAGLSAGVSYFKITLQKEAIEPPNNRLLTGLPRETALWIQDGVDRREQADVEEVLGTKNYISRVYVRKDSRSKKDGGSGEGVPVRLDFHAAYYTGMIDTVPHVPDRCFVGGGLQIGGILGDLPLPLNTAAWVQDESVPEHLAGKIFRVRLPNDFSTAPGVNVRLPRDPKEIALRTMEFRSRDEQPFYAGYFFVANGGWVSSAEGVRLLAFDLRTKYAFYMKVQVTSVSGITSGEQLAKEAASLLDGLLPELMLCVPDWVEVEEGRYPEPTRSDTAASGST